MSSNKIDPSKIHLGGITPEYYAEYLPIASEDQPPVCVLPAEIPLELHPRPIVPLNLSCEFQFPPITPIPPVYVPPIPPPPPFYPSCSTLVASTNITTCPSTKNSFLTLTTAGPESNTEGKPSECELTLSGSICVEACETFEAEANIGFGGALQGKSGLSLVSRSSPECGFTLQGYIDVDACVSFGSSANINFLGAAAGSVLTLESSSAPDCGLSLVGSINVNACENFFAVSNVFISGTAVEPGSYIGINSNSTPNCGVELYGDVKINACKEITVSSNVAFNGSAFNPTYKTFAKIGEMVPAKGAEGEDRWDSTGTYIIEGLKVPASPPKPSPPNFKILTNEERAKLKNKPTPPPGYSDTMVERKKFSSLQLVSTGDCGISLQGSLEMQACEDFGIKGGLKISGKPVKIVKPIEFKPSGQPDCGIDIEGEIEIKGCEEINLSATASGGTVSIYSGGAVTGSISLAPQVKLTKEAGGCGYSLDLAFPNSWIDLSAGGVGTGGGGGGGAGGGGSGPGGGPGGGSGGSGSGSGSGSGGKCCSFNCSEEQGGIRAINLDVLEVTNIYQTQYPCCESDCTHFINLCAGLINVSKVQADTFMARDCCGNTGNSIDLCNGTINLTGNDGATMYMDAWSFSHVTGSRSVSLAGSCLTVDSGDTGGSSTVCDSGVTVKDLNNNTTAISPGYISCSEGSPACHKVEINGLNGVVYASDCFGAYVSIDPSNVRVSSSVGNYETQISGNSIVIGSDGSSDSEGSSLQVDQISATSSGSSTSLDLKEGSLYIDARAGGAATANLQAGSLELVSESNDSASLSGGGLYIKAELGGSSSLTSETLSLNNGSSSVTIAAGGLPSGVNVYFRQISICENKKTKTAWVLMSDPVDSN